MNRLTRGVAITLTLAVLLTVFGLQRPARADDAGAIIGGLIAGALIYEALDNDHHPAWYYGPPRAVYPRSAYYYPRPYRVVRIWCPVCHTYRPRWHTHYYRSRWVPAVSYRASSHAVYADPRPPYRKPSPHPGRKHNPPRRYTKY